MILKIAEFFLCFCLHKFQTIISVVHGFAKFLEYVVHLIKFTSETTFLKISTELHLVLITLFSSYLLCFSTDLVVNCSDPGIPANSKRESKIEHGNFTYGTVVFYDCNPGYFLFGSSVLICQPNGQWDKPLPECISK